MFELHLNASQNSMAVTTMRTMSYNKAGSGGSREGRARWVRTNYPHPSASPHCIKPPTMMLIWQILFGFLPRRLHHCIIICRISSASGGLVPQTPNHRLCRWTLMGDFHLPASMTTPLIPKSWIRPWETQFIVVCCVLCKIVTFID